MQPTNVIHCELQYVGLLEFVRVLAAAMPVDEARGFEYTSGDSFLILVFTSAHVDAQAAEIVRVRENVCLEGVETLVDARAPPLFHQWLRGSPASLSALSLLSLIGVLTLIGANHLVAWLRRVRLQLSVLLPLHLEMSQHVDADLLLLRLYSCEMLTRHAMIAE